MRVKLEEDIERQRVITELSQRGVGPYGKFRLLCPVFGRSLGVLAFDGRYEEGTPKDHPAYGWEHVSVSGTNFCPNWAEMCWIKDRFWLEHEPVIQMHPPKSEWVNNHPYCLHLWAPILSVLEVTDLLHTALPDGGRRPPYPDRYFLKDLPRPPKSSV